MSSASEATTKLNSGDSIPLLGFGTVLSGEPGPFKEALKAALLVANYRHIDTAWYYGTEPYIGEVLEEVFDLGKVKREEVFITTKVWPCYWNDPENSFNTSLKDLQLDYVDLLLQHWPICFQKVESEDGTRVPVPKDQFGNILFDKDGDYLIMYRKLLKIKDSGKAKNIGVSNYTIEMLERVIKETGVTPATNQVEMHPHLPQLDLYKYCKEKGIVVEAYSPLGSSGAPNLKIPLVQDLAKKYNVGPADIIVNYLIAKDIVALPRSSNVERVKKGYPLLDFKREDVEALDKFGSENPKRFIRDPWGKNLGFEHWD
jgi:D-arabinose 1-dehydrogenase